MTVETSYPFGDSIDLSATASSRDFELLVRVPGWAGGEGGTAELVDSSGAATPLTGLNGTLVRVGVAKAHSAPLVATLRLLPKLRIEQWAKGGYSVHRGPLMFSLPITPHFHLVTHHWGTDQMSNDYDTTNASAWQYALVADASNPDASLSFETAGSVSAAPFNRSSWPVVVRATVRPLPGWGLTKNSASEPPPSPACAASGACGEAQQVLLVPHGASDLRIGQFPLT